PDVVEDLLLGQHPVRVHHQIPQQFELGGGELNDLSLATNLVDVVVQLQVVEGDDRIIVAGGSRTAQYRLDASYDLIQRERFGDVVIAADGQAGDLIVGVIACGEEEHREVLSGSPQPTGHGEAVHIRQ